MELIQSLCGFPFSFLLFRMLGALFPHLRPEIHVTLVEEASTGASVREHFHQSTALITTTSFMNLIFFDSFYESSCACEKPHLSNSHSHARKSSDRRISTVS